jgi:DNA-binding transcriptional regulator YiaG
LYAAKKKLVTVGITCGKLWRMEASELQQRREALGMSRDELAKALQTTSVSVWRWENGERAVPPYLSLALETVERERGQPANGAAKKAKAKK